MSTMRVAVAFLLPIVGHVGKLDPASALTGISPIIRVASADLTETTLCPKLPAVVDSGDRERIKQARDLVLNIMDTLDSTHTEQGEPGIMSQLTDDGENSLVAMVSVHCREYPRMTIYNSTAFVYRGTRDIEVELGVAK